MLFLKINCFIGCDVDWVFNLLIFVLYEMFCKSKKKPLIQHGKISMCLLYWQEWKLWSGYKSSSAYYWFTNYTKRMVIDIFWKEVLSGILHFSVSFVLLWNVQHFFNDLKKDIKRNFSRFAEDTYLVAKYYISEINSKIGLYRL